MTTYDRRNASQANTLQGALEEFLLKVVVNVQADMMLRLAIDTDIRGRAIAAVTPLMTSDPDLMVEIMVGVHLKKDRSGVECNVDTHRYSKYDQKRTTKEDVLRFDFEDTINEISVGAVREVERQIDEHIDDVKSNRSWSKK